jgi:hypothetical protein
VEGGLFCNLNGHSRAQMGSSYVSWDRVFKTGHLCIELLSVSTLVIMYKFIV